MASDESAIGGQRFEAEAGEGGKAAPASPRSPADSGLREDGALALLKRPDVDAEILEQLAKNGNLLKYSKVKRALVEHAKTPRHVSLPLVRTLFTFDLMQVALTPTTPADVKRAADEALCNRLESISAGERLSLARRASTRVAGALLHDRERRVIHAALENSRLTEAAVVKALMGADAAVALVEAVSHHPQWSLRREVRVALLRNEKTPLARAMEFARSLPPRDVREILHNSRLPANIKACVLKDQEQRRGRAARAGGE
ncbi:MAG TPA: hypothetical protein VEI01_03470 [Terriglobales bacterium]|nr:hypothetical protein [Terriglobales bacterium]